MVPDGRAEELVAGLALEARLQWLGYGLLRHRDDVELRNDMTNRQLIQLISTLTPFCLPYLLSQYSRVSLGCMIHNIGTLANNDMLQS